jgi:2-keto-4-pentenoate hydratase/2-oxohepta-3-ene-1,7-dioic acid hydratase in catechol pathway
MRIVSYRAGDRVAFGVKVDSGVVDVSDGISLFDFLLLSPEAKSSRVADAVRRGVPARPMSELMLLPAVPRPGKFICLGLNYIDHAKEGGHAVPPYPTLFMRGPTSLTAAGAPIVQPSLSDTLDYEAELAVVIGRPARNVREADALQQVAAYALFNDATVREYQRITTQWTPGKNFDGTGAFGPELVTPDELPPGATGLRIQSRLNGKVMQDGNTSDMMFGVAHTIALLSRIMTLDTGDVLAMGTPAGVGHARKPPVWMRPGDVCEIEIDKLGVLSNPIVAEVDDEQRRAAR